MVATAFGPFPDEVVVDFDALTAQGLFLIHGPTGAGKTSLLDAICFALFADVPGLRDRRGIVSDHAAPTATPSIELEFTSGTRRFRLHRSPQHARPKKRGVGTVDAPATVTLSELRGVEWAVVSTRNDETAEVLHDVIGMGKEQFAKVAMLPQGEFAAFLTAKDEDRRALLEKLFDISRFADIEAWLVEQRRESEAAVGALRAGIDTDLARLGDVLAASGVSSGSPPVDTAGGPHAGTSTNAPAPDRPAADELAVDPASPEGIRAHLESVGADLDQHLSQMMVALDAAIAVEGATAERAEQARAVTALRQRATTARRTLADLDASAEELIADRARLDAGQRAVSLRGHLATIQREEVTLQGARQALDVAMDSVSRLVDIFSAATDGAIGSPSHPEEAGTLFGRPQDALAAMHGHDDALREAGRLSESRLHRERRTEELIALIEKATRVLGRADADRASAALAVTSAEAMVGDSADAVASREGATVLAAAARDRHELARRTVDDAIKLDALRRAAAETRTAAQDARDHEQDLLARRLSQMAAELAEGLLDDEPCPVCGSDDHPEPTTSRDRVSGAELDEARRVHAALVQAHQDADARATAAQARLEHALQVLDVASVQEIALTSLAEAAETAQRDLALISDRAARLQASQQSLDSARARLARVDESVVAAERDLAQARTISGQERSADCHEATALADLLKSHESCPCAPGSPPSTGRTLTLSADDVAMVREITATHSQVIRLVEAWRNASHDHEVAETRLHDVRADAQSAAHEAGFDSIDGVTHALMMPNELDRLRDRIQGHDRARAAAQSVLDDPEVLAAEAAEEPDVHEATADAARARAAVLTAQAAQTEAATARKSFVTVRTSLLKGLDAAGPALVRHHRIKDLADAFTGGGVNNTLRMRLTSYVLASRLDKVARLANERLRIMGDGRYTLEHSDRLAARGARSGLGLRVLDQWTGVSRETSTLSGGEAFMASLALALGLADAVREESGGFDLGTLFVDEGFGTLDDESLEQVISVLDSLREGGRAVGVVSHVGELRSRITSQLLVRKTASGSTVSISGPGVESAA
ncbi:hypothetical protein N802_15110 [Knoellia sinensis KCTC 19936]|uniref:Nuclease SbcCD subunit C n=1 Tax=Knoellia sinensis KCTC 19936 TaxID=1385520 RepID=A0A0A0J9G0_9MICO|nr:AAA family ATPase [Knoellia sinensis]KGN33409.1 hypothetical protein N802_15110 [Knoellia sinensis KCTC 19936]